MVNAIDFLSLTLHTTPFLNVKLYLGDFHKLRANFTRPDKPKGSKPLHLQVGVFQNLECTSRTIDLFCSLVFTYLLGDTAVQS